MPYFISAVSGVRGRARVTEPNRLLRRSKRIEQRNRVDIEDQEETEEEVIASSQDTNVLSSSQQQLSQSTSSLQSSQQQLSQSTGSSSQQPFRLNQPINLDPNDEGDEYILFRQS